LIEEDERDWMRPPERKAELSTAEWNPDVFSLSWNFSILRVFA
jgi:hypothetical protein